MNYSFTKQITKGQKTKTKNTVIIKPIIKPILIIRQEHTVPTTSVTFQLQLIVQYNKQQQNKAGILHQHVESISTCFPISEPV